MYYRPTAKRKVRGSPQHLKSLFKFISIIDQCPTVLNLVLLCHWFKANLESGNITNIDNYRTTTLILEIAKLYDESILLWISCDDALIHCSLVVNIMLAVQVLFLLLNSLLNILLTEIVLFMYHVLMSVKHLIAFIIINYIIRYWLQMHVPVFYMQWVLKCLFCSQVV
jgi:hypothetical protein